MIEPFRIVESWTEDDLLDLPDEESENYEYKSSELSPKKLKEKLAIAASAFWNSGGGIFIAGVDDNGKIDGGVPASVGRQTLRDWADQVLASVEPLGPYAIKTITRKNATSLINEEQAILVVSFGVSVVGPHMAQDKKYYVRAGAHSGSVGHFIVEAIRARRGLQKPILCGLIRRNEHKPNTMELAILALNLEFRVQRQIARQLESYEPREGCTLKTEKRSKLARIRQL